MIRKVPFFLLLLGILFASSWGQPAPQAELIDEVGPITCDDFLARADNFIARLKNEPAAMGYAVITGTNQRPMNKLAYELWLNGALNTYRLDPDRIKLIRGAESGDFKMSYWLVPPGADKPPFEETGWNFVLPDGTKPFIVHDDMEQICSTKGYEKVIVEFLGANPRSRSNILIREKSMRKFEKEKKVILGRFPGEFHNRIKFFYEKSSSSSSEFWLFPRGK